MKFIVRKPVIFKTLSHLQSIVNKKNTLPILSNRAPDPLPETPLTPFLLSKSHQKYGRKLSKEESTQEGLSLVQALGVPGPPPAPLKL